MGPLRARWHLCSDQNQKPSSLRRGCQDPEQMKNPRTMGNFQTIKTIKLSCYNSAVGCPRNNINLATKHTSSWLAPEQSCL